MSASTPTDANPTRRTAVRSWLVWTAGFLAYPVAGVLGTAAAGRVETPAAAAVGGLAAGAALGLGQALVSSRRLGILRWTVATALGMGAGLLLGAHAVGYGTTLGQLALMGALTGAVLGPSQALALPSSVRRRWLWAVWMPAVWATGWAVSAVVIGDAVDAHLTLFGASGAVVASAVLGALLHLVSGPAATTVPDPSPLTAARPPATTGDPS